MEDVDSVLIRPPHQLDTQLLVRCALVQDHVDAVIPDREVVHAVGRVAHRHLVAVPVWVAVRVGAVAVALFPEHRQPQELAGLLEGGHSVAVRHVADVDAVHLAKSNRKMLVEKSRKGASCSETVPDGYGYYLQDHVPRQQASVPGDDALSVDVLDEDADQGCLVAADNADGERFRGICPCDLDTGEFAVGDQVMQLRKSQHCRNKAEAKILDSFEYLFIFWTVLRKRERGYLTGRQLKQTRGGCVRSRLSKTWWTAVESFSSGTSCLYSRRLLKQTRTSQGGKLAWLIILPHVCAISHIHL